MEEAQAGSFELQRQHYLEYINNKPEWTLAGIYADEGVSGTSMQKRIGFIQMIDDCHAGKIDYIITKSVSRFARNTRDCLQVVRELKNCDPPIGVFFEIENINTLDISKEFTLGVLSLVAQEESIKKSESVKWAFIERAKKGITRIQTHNLLGYDKDRFGKVIIAEEEAEIIRYIFDSYLLGNSPGEIASKLTEACVPTVMGNRIWHSTAITNIIHNEKYCGDCLLQKTYTVDCFSHKSRKNNGQLAQYYIKNSHPPIIPRERWVTAQNKTVRGNRRSQNAAGLRQKLYLTHIKSGILKGFMLLDPKWSISDINKLLEKITKEN